MLRSGAYSELVEDDDEALRSLDAVIVDGEVAVRLCQGRCTSRWRCSAQRLHRDNVVTGVLLMMFMGAHMNRGISQTEVTMTSWSRSSGGLVLRRVELSTLDLGCGEATLNLIFSFANTQHLCNIT